MAEEDSEKKKEEGRRAEEDKEEEEEGEGREEDGDQREGEQGEMASYSSRSSPLTKQEISTVGRSKEIAHWNRGVSSKSNQVPLM
ncbi:hypothetical protein INR49_017618 [Caranx melampygus]|nr:hypothetical protein INR49_017618 [Caranx melampygus]